MPRLAPALAPLAALLAALGAASSVQAAPRANAAALLAGDDAPPLRVGSWLAGTPVENLDRGTVYVVELWGTSNSQCKVTLPALADLAKRHADVRFVAVAVNEPDAVAARAFVRSQGDALAGVSIATDDGSLPTRALTPEQQAEGVELVAGSTARDWWQAGGSEFSPVAFVVNADGVVAWTGPAMRVEGPLKQVLDGTFDVDAARRAGVAAAEARAQELAATNELGNAVAELANPNDTAAVIGLIDALALKYPAAKSRLLWPKFEMLLANKQYDQAYQASDELCAAAVELHDSMALNRVAWSLVGNDDNQMVVEHPDVARAKRYAEQAVAASDGTSGAILDTLARAQFLDGEFGKAVANEARAAAICDEADREGVERALQTYRAAAATRPTK